MSEGEGGRRRGRRARGEAAANPSPGAAGQATGVDGHSAASDEGTAEPRGPAAGPDGAGPPHIDRSVCLCAGLGPMLTQALRTLSVPDEVKQSLHDTEREALRLLRTLIEMRLSSLGTDDGRPREPVRGVKLDVS